MKTEEIECHECDSAFTVNSIQAVGTIITCPSCNHTMIVNDDYDEEGGTFWYLDRIKDLT